MTEEAALKHIKHAWVAGLISAGLTLLLIIIVSVSGSPQAQEFAELGFDWWALLDVALILGLCFGVYRKSRICAVLLFAYFVLAKIYIWLAMGNVQGLLFAIIFAYFFFQGIRGTFAYHSLLEQTPLPEQTGLPQIQRKTTNWLWILGGSATVLVVALLALILYVGSVGPPTKVIPGAQVPKRFLSTIQALDLLEPEEQLLFFYSDALADIEDGFYLLTDRKVILYSSAFEEPAILVPFSMIDDVDVQFDESFWNDSQISLALADGTYVWFPVSSEGGGDRQFYEALMQRWEAHVQSEDR